MQTYHKRICIVLKISIAKLFRQDEIMNANPVSSVDLKDVKVALRWIKLKGFANEIEESW